MTGTMLAIGDSITARCAPDLAICGVPARAYPEWMAESLGMDLTTVAALGATLHQLRSAPLREWRDRGDRFDLAVVYAGTNNAIGWRAWHQETWCRFEATIGLAQRAMALADRVVLVALPDNLGHTRVPLAYGPRLAERVAAINRLIKVASAESPRIELHQAPSLSEPDLWIDGVHPTSTGHYRLADDLLRRMGEAGLPPLTLGTPDAEWLAFRARRLRRFALTQPARSAAARLLRSSPLRPNAGWRSWERVLEESTAATATWV